MEERPYASGEDVLTNSVDQVWSMQCRVVALFCIHMFSKFIG
jgi:hypothetical protein